MTAKLLEEMPLQELRQALDLTQKEVAQSLKIEQAAVSKMEKQTDMYLSTLRRFIAAMGGELEIIAHFPEDTVCALRNSEMSMKTLHAPAVLGR